MAAKGQTSGSDARSGIVVTVPTTAAPILLRGLRWTQRIPASRVVLGNETADQCERWTKDYNNLLRPGDPMRTLLGLPDSGGYRLVASAEIDHGASWIMPVVAGHFGTARGESLHADLTKALLMVWTTGAIDFSMAESAQAAKVVPNDYHLTAKIDNSRDLFAAAAHAGTPVLCLLPQGDDAERASKVLGKVLGDQPHAISIVGSLAELTAQLDRFLKASDFMAAVASSGSLVPFRQPEESKPTKTASNESEQSQPQPAQPYEPPGSRGTTSYSTKPAAQQAMSGKTIALIAAASLAAVSAVAAAFINSRPVSTPVPVAAKSDPAPAAASTEAPQKQASVQPAASQPSLPSSLATDASVVAKLTILKAPAGSSCQAQVYQIQPQFSETVLELTADKAQADVEAASLCGLAVTGAGAARARFLQSSVDGVVPSLSSANRLIFNPASQADRLPVIALEGTSLARIELRKR